MPWVDIPNSVFESGKPARALDMRNLRDNIAAALAGESGAPKFYPAALLEVVSGSVILRDCLNGLSTVLPVGTSSTAQEQVESSVFTALRDCTIQTLISWTRTLSGIGGSSTISVIKNGSAVHTWTAASGTDQTVDTPLAAGDRFAIRLRIDGGNGTGGQNLTVSKLQILGSALSGVLL